MQGAEKSTHGGRARGAGQVRGIWPPREVWRQEVAIRPFRSKPRESATRGPEVWSQNLAVRGSDTKRRGDHSVETDAKVSKYKDQMTDTQGAGPAFSPIKVFLALLAVIAVIVGVILATSGEEEPVEDLGISGSSGFSLTDPEALERAQELSELSFQAIQSRDLALVSRVYTANSPAGDRIAKEIQNLRTNNVVDHSTIDDKEFALLSNSRVEIRVRETRVLNSCFRNEAGKDVSKGVEAIQQIGVWVLRMQDSEWLVYDALLERDRVVDESRARCP
jgi:hypothetical protein